MREGTSRIQRWLVASLLLFVAGCAGEYPQTMIQPVSEFGRIQIDLWELVTWWTVGIMVVVFGALILILIKFRGKPGDPTPKAVYGSTKLEILWTVIPAVITLFIAIPTVQAIFATQARAPEGALVVEAIGHQWWWEFRYPELGITTANEFYVPVGRPVSFQLRSADVIHSFWIPRFGGKKDVNPVVRTPEGVNPLHLNEIALVVDSTGEYLGQCAEFCGASHAIMRMMGVAVTEAEFEDWVQDFRATPEPVPGSDAAVGRDIFMRSTCIACHAIEGTTARGVLGPSLTLMGERFSIAAGLMENTEENLTEWILRAPELKRGVIMPGAEVGAAGMAPTGLSEEEARAVAVYLSSLRRPGTDVPAPAAPADAAADTAQ